MCMEFVFFWLCSNGSFRIMRKSENNALQARKWEVICVDEGVGEGHARIQLCHHCIFQMFCFLCSNWNTVNSLIKNHRYDLCLTRSPTAQMFLKKMSLRVDGASKCAARVCHYHCENSFARQWKQPPVFCIRKVAGSNRSCVTLTNIHPSAATWWSFLCPWGRHLSSSDFIKSL